MLFKLIICIIAGLGAGIGTGFAGMSAAVVIAPMLVAFLDFPAYQSVGIALISDVLASACSAVTYAKNRHIDIRGGMVLLITVLMFTLVGSGVAYEISKSQDSLLGGFQIFMTCFLGLRFLIRPVNTTKEKREQLSRRRKILMAIGSGIYIGFVCGFMGAGGGLMMLFVLTTLLGYELKTAVGTSVFVMSFTALTGAVSHFVVGGIYDIPAMLLCIAFTLLGAVWSAKIANHIDNRHLNLFTGWMLVIMGAAMCISKFLL